MRISLPGIRLGPAALHGNTVLLRPPRLADFGAWRRIRLRDRRLIEPFWFSSPLDWSERHTGKLWVREVLTIRADARRGRRLALAIEVDGRFAGQIELGSLDRAAGSGEMGIWVDAQVARRGLGGLAAALLLDFGFGPGGLARITAPISPANIAAASGAAQMGFRREALMRQYFDTDGARRDHELWAITESDVPPGGFVTWWIARHQGALAGAPAAVDRNAVDDETLSPATIFMASVRYALGRLAHLADPVRSSPRVRLENPGPPHITVRNRKLTDWPRWRAAWLRQSGPGCRFLHWLRESLCAHAGLRSRQGLILAIETDGSYSGECRLFDLDMFDGNARLAVWGADPAARETAVRMLLDHAFGGLGLRRVAMAIEPGNSDAAELAARVGMIREGTMRAFAVVGTEQGRADHDLWAAVAAHTED
ncbi:GNAT family N-acetyltransferase [Nocardia arthritidis]|uniref:GNAT family N-acetyltransferase n=1 Tax=Nocardia arthritidis TaxID=228602 RepID=A0A6G9YG47_9NOCA|nr:GNAT family protein [Nocardia arthritidis]QIS11943.1 GNAT family N-acetyltransferase [Nocardia arthritidis]